MRRPITAGGLALALAAGLLVASAGSAQASVRPGWTSGAALTSGTPASQTPQVTIDDRGNETVAYLGGSLKQVYVTTRLAGSSTWETAAAIPGSAEVVGVDGIVADGSGALTAVWRYLTIYGYDAVAAARKPAGGAWGPVQTLNDFGANDVPDPADVAVDGLGNVTVVWTAVPKPTGTTLPRASRWSAADGWSTPTTLSDGSHDVTDVHVAADSVGDAMVVWTYSGSPQEIQSNLYVPGTGWQASAETAISASGSPRTPQITAAGEGTFAAVWVRDDPVTAYASAEAARYTIGGGWAALPSIVSPLPNPGYDYKDPKIVADAAGDLTIIFLIKGNSVWQAGTNTLPVGGSSWGSGYTGLSYSGYTASDPHITSDPAGNLTAVWTQNDGSNGVQVATAYRQAGQSWVSNGYSPISAAGADASGLQVAVDGFDNVAAVWSRPDGSAVSQIEEARWSSGEPIVTMTSPTSAFSTDTSLHVAWQASDWAGGTSLAGYYAYDLNRAVGLWNRRLGAYSTLVSSFTGTEGWPTVKPGRTYCFEASGTYVEVPVTGVFSEPTCTTTPVDDRTATVSSGWARKTYSGFYQGTGTVTTLRGATMTLKGVKARELALLVAKGPGNGKIKVLWNGHRIGVYRLAAAANHKEVVLDLKTFRKVTGGTLQIVVLTSGKPVRIDGIYAAK